MRPIGWLAITLCLGSAACGGDTPPQDCEDLAADCMAAQAGPAGDLLVQSVVNGCIEDAANDDDMACANDTQCQAECTAPEAPTAESDLFGCWLSTADSVKICMGMDYVPGATTAHAYAWYEPAGSATPTFSGEFETREQFDRAVLYDFQQAGQNGCFRVEAREDAMFTTDFLAQSQTCDTVSETTIGPFVSRFSRVL